MKEERSKYSSYSPEPRKDYQQDEISRLRTTIVRIEDRSSDLYALRNTYSATSLGKSPSTTSIELRLSNLNNSKKNTFQGLKETLNILEDKIKNAKEQLQLPSAAMKKKQQKFIFCEEDDNDVTKPSDSSITLKDSSKKISTLITNISKPKNFKPTYTNPYSPRRHLTYYVSECIRAINEKNSIAMQHLSGSIRIIKSCQRFEVPGASEVEAHKLNLHKSQFYRNKKTLVLDLDQTLIHCVENQNVDSDLKLDFKVDNQNVTVGINIRPYAISFLKKMAKKFEIIIFTASHFSYADAILDELDPEGEIFQHRLYRQHCFILGKEYHVKDLRIINRNLSEMVLVDNAAYSYAFQLENGIPILPYYEGSDYELAALENYLDQLDRVQDVREVNKKNFKLHHYSKFESSEELVEQLYMNNFN